MASRNRYLGFILFALSGALLFPVKSYASDKAPSKYTVFYELNEGAFPSKAKIPETMSLTEEDNVPPTPVREGYYFDGWYYTKDYTNYHFVLSSEIGDNADSTVTFYAKWREVIPTTPEIIDDFSNLIEGEVKVDFMVEGENDGYELEFSKDEYFEGPHRTVRSENVETLNPRNLLKNTNYYFRIHSYCYDSTGAKIYSDYSKTVSFFVENGVTEVPATSTSGEIHSIEVQNGSLQLDATIAKRVAGYDEYYYLVTVDPFTNDVKHAVATLEKDIDLSVILPFNRTGGTMNIMSKFALAVKQTENSYFMISEPSLITNPEGYAPNQNDFPTPRSKKGRQGYYDTGVGDKNFFHNFYLDSIIGTASSHDVTYSYNGNTYYFYLPTHTMNYDNWIKAANANGGTVSMQIMLRYSNRAAHLITPSGRTPGKSYYAFNMEEAGPREEIEAAFCYLADYWGKENRHVDNWILGNEVNTYLNPIGWYYAGNKSHDEFMKNYTDTFRALYYAVRSSYANARVYICLDHTWNDRDHDWGAMPFMKAFSSYITDISEDIHWDVAYHPYTAVLTNADPWNDGGARSYSVAHSTGADYVSAYNLEVLTDWVRDHLGGDTRIILSEVGYSSTGGTSRLNAGRQSGGNVQAAAYAYLYYKAQFTDNVDAVIFHVGDEGQAGFNFNIAGKPAWNVYKYMDTPSYASYVNDYLGTIGASSWEQIIPGFNSATLSSMPNR